MWEITGIEIIKKYQGNDDKRFSSLVDNIITNHAKTRSIPISSIVSNVRETIPDGGVDTEIKIASTLDGDEWLSKPTCWQYKASPYSAVTPAVIKKEVNKKYAKALIKKGYA